MNVCPGINGGNTRLVYGSNIANQYGGSIAMVAYGGQGGLSAQKQSFLISVQSGGDGGCISSTDPNQNNINYYYSYGGGGGGLSMDSFPTGFLDIIGGGNGQQVTDNNNIMHGGSGQNGSTSYKGLAKGAGGLGGQGGSYIAPQSAGDGGGGGGCYIYYGGSPGTSSPAPNNSGNGGVGTGPGCGGGGGAGGSGGNGGNGTDGSFSVCWSSIPTMPVILSITQTVSRAVNVTIQPSTNEDGSAITYTVTSTNGQYINSSNTSIVFTGLTPGPQIFTVQSTSTNNQTSSTYSSLYNVN